MKITFQNEKFEKNHREREKRKKREEIDRYPSTAISNSRKPK